MIISKELYSPHVNSLPATQNENFVKSEFDFKDKVWAVRRTAKKAIRFMDIMNKALFAKGEKMYWSHAAKQALAGVKQILVVAKMIKSTIVLWEEPPHLSRITKIYNRNNLLYSIVNSSIVLAPLAGSLFQRSKEVLPIYQLIASSIKLTKHTEQFIHSSENMSPEEKKLHLIKMSKAILSIAGSVFFLITFIYTAALAPKVALGILAIASVLLGSAKAFYRKVQSLRAQEMQVY
ncbi:MAG: hypothetical protein K2X08_07905 [Chlamydiales bacterium]|nr:hypothetical protein [Chlamydiales bacterium]